MSPPSEGPKSTHHTSPRSMWLRQGIADHAFAPLQRLFFARWVGCHFAIGSFGVLRQDGGAREFLNELADPAPADGAVKAFIDGLTDGYGKLPVHTLSYTYYTRIGASSLIRTRGRDLASIDSGGRPQCVPPHGRPTSRGSCLGAC